VAEGKTIAMPFIVRPRPKAPVSWPITWPDVERFARSRAPDLLAEASRWNISTAPALLKKHGDGWKEALRKVQRLEPALKKAQKSWT